MEIKLEFITGKNEAGEDIVIEKTFVAGIVKSRLVRRAIELKKDLGAGNVTLELIDTLVDFTCECYAHKFTRDELYDGLDSKLFFPTVVGSVEGVINGVLNKLNTFPEV